MCAGQPIYRARCSCGRASPGLVSRATAETWAAEHREWVERRFDQDAAGHEVVVRAVGRAGSEDD